MRSMLLLLCLLGGIYVQAQAPYRLFHPDVQYLYSHELPASGFTSPLLGIRVGTDDCHVLYESLQPNIPAGDPECLVRVPAFVGSEICQTDAATTLNLRSDEAPLLLTLYPAAPVGQVWLAVVDAADSVYAKVDAVEWTSVLGLMDSVKLLNFYTLVDGDFQPLYDEAALRISRNYGLVSGVFLHWLGTETGPVELVGLDGPELGTQNPDREDVFQLAPGDEIHVITVTTQFFNESYYNEHREKKNTFVSEGQLPNGSRYYAFRGDQKIYQEGPEANTDTLWLDAAPDTVFVNWGGVAFLDEQPGALVVSSFHPDGWQVVSLGHRYFCEHPAKRLSAPFLITNEDCAEFLFDIIPGDDFYAFYSGPYYRHITLGGLLYRTLEYAAVASEPECGIPFDFVVNTFDLPLSESLRVWPNPSTGFVNLKWPSELKTIDGLRLIDTYGRIVYEAPNLSLPSQLDLSALPAGNYYLHCVTPQGKTIVKKLTKQ